jgi:uncharacterized membrane protein HdeD (DUF308 family)
MESGKISNFLKGIRRNAMFCSLLLFLVGLFLLIKPDAAIAVVCRVIGAAILIAGASQCVSYLNGRSGGLAVSESGLAAGIILILAGLIIVIRPNIIFDLFNFVIACVLIFYGVTELIAVREFSRIFGSESRISMINGIVTLVCGVLMLVVPFLFHATELILRIAGVFMVYAAISSLFFKKHADTVYSSAEADFSRAADEIRNELSGRSRYDENGKEIIDGTAVDVDDSTDNN